MNGYELSRAFWDFSFENPEKVKPAHASVYFFAIEHCNRLGWAKKFGLPASMVMSACGIHSYNTYIKIFNDLIDWDFFKLVQKSRNQYSSNIIALLKNDTANDTANDKALDKALIKHSTKQHTKRGESIDSINKQENKETKKQETKEKDFSLLDSLLEKYEAVRDINSKNIQEIEDNFSALSEKEKDSLQEFLYLDEDKRFLKKYYEENENGKFCVGVENFLKRKTWKKLQEEPKKEPVHDRMAGVVLDTTPPNPNL